MFEAEAAPLPVVVRFVKSSDVHRAVLKVGWYFGTQYENINENKGTVFRWHAISVPVVFWFTWCWPIHRPSLSLDHQRAIIFCSAWAKCCIVLTRIRPNKFWYTGMLPLSFGKMVP